MPRNPNKIDDSGGFPEGFEVFASIQNPRDGGNTRHHFGEILFIAIPELLEMLNLKGAVVTIDAMGTQRAIAHKIVDKGRRLHPQRQRQPRPAA